MELFKMIHEARWESRKDPIPAYYELGIRREGIVIRMRPVLKERVFSSFSSEVRQLMSNLRFFEERQYRLFREGTGGENRTSILVPFQRLSVVRQQQYDWMPRPHFVRTNWEGLHRISRLLGSLFSIIMHQIDDEKMAIPDAFQLLAINGMGSGEEGSHAAWMSVHVLPPLARWLSRQPGGHLATVERVMSRVYQFMWDAQDDELDLLGSPYGISARLMPPKWLFLGAPGECACLGSDRSGRDEIEDTAVPYEISTHNVDSSLQQLTLLAGLATICELARADRG